tara:strand:- start:16780 stop:17478 length:699 start_codon:yes stop_codon:yes gene_type:complete
MLKRNLSLLYLAIILFCASCASHPPVFPQMPKKGETNMGFTFAAENLIPVIWWRHGLGRYTDLGLRAGIPFSGSGIDLNRVLYKRDRKWDVINISYNLAPNSSFDATYYKFKGDKRINLKNPFGVAWKGYRLMYIPEGVSGGESIRFGMLYGRRFSTKWAVEFGYFHDFRSMPFSKVLLAWDPSDTTNINKYGSNYKEYPHRFEGLPSEYSRSTGLSFQLFMYLGPTKKKKK